MRNVIFIPLLLPLLAPFTTAATFWCGTWAGSPNLRDAPSAGQLPTIDSTRRYFTEPQLQDPPFQPPLGPEPRVQVPKIWGNSAYYTT